MLLHDGELLLGKPAGLVEDFPGNGDLAHIMQGGGDADQVDVHRRELVAVGFQHQAPEEQLRQHPDMDNVLAALAVAELDDVAEDVDHQGVLPLFFIDLVGDHAHQLFLLGVEQGGVDHPAVDQQGVEGAGDEVGDAQVVGPLDMGGRGLGGDHDDRDILNPVVPVHDGQHLKAVHLRHDDVQQKQVDLHVVLLNRAYRLQAVFGFQDLVFLPQHVRQDGAVHLRIVRNQDSLLARMFCVNGSHIPSYSGRSPRAALAAREAWVQL